MNNVEVENNPIIWNPGTAADLEALNDENKTVIWSTTENRIIEVLDYKFKWVRDVVAYFKKGPDMVSGSMARFKIAEAENKLMNHEYMKGINSAYENAMNVTNFDDIQKNIDLLSEARMELSKKAFNEKVTEKFIDVNLKRTIFSPKRKIDEKLDKALVLMQHLAEAKKVFNPDKEIDPLVKTDALQVFYASFDKIQNTGLRHLYDHLGAEEIDNLLPADPKKFIDDWIELIEFAIKNNLPELKQACLDRIPLNVDISTEEGAKSLIALGECIKRNHLPDPLFSSNGTYPPVLEISGEKAVYKDFRTYLSHPKKLPQKEYLAGLKWLESERRGEGAKSIGLENISDLIRFSEFHKIRDLKGQCDSFAKQNIKLLLVNERGEGIDETKWLEWMNLSTKHNLPQLSKACVKELPSIRVDLKNPKSAKHLFEVSKTIGKHQLNDELFSQNKRYPPVKFSSGKGTIPVNFAKLFYFSDMFKGMLEDVDYEEGKSIELDTPFELRHMQALNQWMEAKHQGSKKPENLIINNWKELYLIADYFDIKELKDDCEKSFSEGKIKDLNEAKDLLQLAVGRHSHGIRDSILGLLMKQFRSYSFEEKVSLVSSLENLLQVAASDNDKESCDKILKLLITQFPSCPPEIKVPLTKFFIDFQKNAKYQSSDLELFMIDSITRR